MTLELLKDIPNSTFFIMLISFAISLATSTTNRLLTNREQLRDWNKEISQWRSESMKAARSGDKKLMAKVKKQEKHVMQLQSKMMWQSMKTSLFMMVPMLLLWYVLLPMLITVDNIVAYLPWLGPTLHLNVILWYLLCSFLAGIIFNKLFGLGLGGD
ncbi:MAG TPA: EMC3/TMCO1 family protein [Candidatus Bathyarchaeia archaeon]|nr:EMC3/TMCO1 family protein [Candidatus Bathyarchaeia archaeon]